MKLKIILDNGAGELGSHVVTVPQGEDENTILDRAVIKLIQHSWTLAPGDTIRIVEVD